MIAGAIFALAGLYTVHQDRDNSFFLALVCWAIAGLSCAGVI